MGSKSNITWKVVGTVVLHCGRTLESTEKYTLNDGRELATLMSIYTSSGDINVKVFDVEAGGRVTFNYELRHYLGDTPLTFGFEKSNQTARKTIEHVAAKIASDTE